MKIDPISAKTGTKKLQDIRIAEISDFPDHPFHVRDDDEDMIALIESIKERGVITPATVRHNEKGGYEMISGHRRKRACELAGIETLRCEVTDLSKEDAIILMVDSNVQRSNILPSERAFSYKMRLEAMNRQGERTDLHTTYSPLGNKLGFKTSSAELAENLGESKNQIFRYIRLTELIPEILDMVDERKIAFRPAVEISYLTDKEQYILFDTMEQEDATPSLAQAIKLKELSKNDKLTDDLIFEIMSEEKPNQKEKIKIPREKLRKYFTAGTPSAKIEEIIIKALDAYQKRRKMENRER